jgi:hypothetical protein
LTPTNNLQVAGVLERTTSSRINAEPRWGACARQPRETARDHNSSADAAGDFDEELEETGYDHNNDDQCFILANFLCYSQSGTDQ